MTRAPNHVCPVAVDADTAGRLEALHRSQAGLRRHVCTTCAYVAGRVAGKEHAGADLRRTAWRIDGPFELCEDGAAAPTSALHDLHDGSQAQAAQRWSCAVCAWRMGWREGVNDVRG